MLSVHNVDAGGGAWMRAGKRYQDAGGMIRTPFKRHRPRLSRAQKEVNRAHARIRALGERAAAILKAWKVLAKLRCCPRRTTAIVQAILVLQGIEEDRYSGLKGLSGMGCDRSKPSQNAQAARQ